MDRATLFAFLVGIALLICIIYFEACELTDDNADQRQAEEFDRQNAELFAMVNRPKPSKVVQYGRD